MTVSLSMLAGAGAQILDDNGTPLAGGFIYTYFAGTTSDATTFTTSAGHAGGDNANPIVLDAAGRVPYQIWLTDGVSYKFVVKTSAGVTVRTYDNIYGAQNGDVLTASSGSSLIGFIQSGAGAVATTVQTKLREWVSVKDFGAVGDGASNDTTAIQAAINAAAILNKGVFFPAGTYLITGVLTAGTLASLRGEGADKSILKKTASSGGHILDILGTSQKYDIEIDGLTFDVNFIDSAIAAEYVTNFSIRRCKFKSIPYWGINLGVQNGADASIRNTRVLIEDCVFENGTQTYEHVLIFNSKDVTIRGCSFKTGANAIGVGIYQNVDSILIENCYFNIHIGLYYSVSTNYVSLKGCTFEQCTAAVQGANMSDNGAFGASVTYGLLVNGSKFLSNSAGLQIGAVYNATVEGCLFVGNLEQAIFIDDGGAPVSNQSLNINILGCNFRNNNFSGGASVLNPAILFSAVGGSMYATIAGCSFWDNQGTKTQLYPIAFAGAFTWSEIAIIGCRLSAYSGGMSIGVSSATIGNNVRIVDCMDVSTSLPTGVLLRDARAEWVSTSTGNVAFTGTGDAVAKITAGASNTAILDLGRSGATTSGRIVYDSGNNYELYTAGVARFRIDSGGNIKPSSDNAYSCGTASNRWSVVYSATGAINTSDARQKQQIRTLTEKERSVGIKLKSLIRAYKFTDAVEKKGDGARIHVGVIAQEVVQAFAEEGLDACDYAVLCYDEWDELSEAEFVEQFAEDGSVELVKTGNLKVVREAGNRYGVRYDQLLAFVISAI